MRKTDADGRPLVQKVFDLTYPNQHVTLNEFLNDLKTKPAKSNVNIILTQHGSTIITINCQAGQLNILQNSLSDALLNAKISNARNVTIGPEINWHIQINTGGTTT